MNGGRIFRAITGSCLKRHASHKAAKAPRRLCLIGTMGTCTYAQVLVTAKDAEKLKPPDPNTLTHSYLIRNAAAASVDAAITLLNQTVTALIELHGQYLDALQQLQGLMELSINVLGNDYQEERVWDSILQVHTKLNEQRRQKEELELLFASLECLVNKAAEAAYLSGAEYASEVGNERLYAAQQKVSQITQLSKDAEQQVAKVEVKVIEETAKQEKQKKEKSKETETGVKEESDPSGPVDIPVLEESGGVDMPVLEESGGVLDPQEDRWFSRILEPDAQPETDGHEESIKEGKSEDERKWANTR